MQLLEHVLFCRGGRFPAVTHGLFTPKAPVPVGASAKSLIHLTCSTLRSRIKLISSFRVQNLNLSSRKHTTQGEGQIKEFRKKIKVWLCGSAPSSQWPCTAAVLLCTGVTVSFIIYFKETIVMSYVIEQGHHLHIDTLTM